MLSLLWAQVQSLVRQLRYHKPSSGDQKKKKQQKRVPTETQKKYPIKVIWTATRVWLSLSPPLCLCTCTLFPPNKHLTCFTTFCLYVEIHFYAVDGPGPCQWSRIQSSHCHGLTSICGWKPQPCFKPLLPEAIRDQSDCIGTRKLLPDVKEELIMEVWCLF